MYVTTNAPNKYYICQALISPGEERIVTLFYVIGYAFRGSISINNIVHNIYFVNLRYVCY